VLRACVGRIGALIVVPFWLHLFGIKKVERLWSDPICSFLLAQKGTKKCATIQALARARTIAAALSALGRAARIVDPRALPSCIHGKARYARPRESRGGHPPHAVPAGVDGPWTVVRINYPLLSGGLPGASADSVSIRGTMDEDLSFNLLLRQKVEPKGDHDPSRGPSRTRPAAQAPRDGRGRADRGHPPHAVLEHSAVRWALVRLCAPVRSRPGTDHHGAKRPPRIVTPEVARGEVWAGKRLSGVSYMLRS
jgi:hypothetical protein